MIVTIHDPTERKVTIGAAMALATDFGSDPGRFAVIAFAKADLEADSTIGMNCFDFAFFEGMAMIESPVPPHGAGVSSAGWSNRPRPRHIRPR